MTDRVKDYELAKQLGRVDDAPAFVDGCSETRRLIAIDLIDAGFDMVVPGSQLRFTRDQLTEIIVNLAQRIRNGEYKRRTDD